MPPRGPSNRADWRQSANRFAGAEVRLGCRRGATAIRRPAPRRCVLPACVSGDARWDVLPPEVGGRRTRLFSPSAWPLAPSKIVAMQPLVVPRDQHGLSRRDVDSDALKVLYRLKDAGFKAYIVGGGVRDLLLGRRPKDFDIGTDAHPYQIKKLFRNCFIIGRRFRLAHIRFGTKVIEVATFRRQVSAEEAAEAEAAARTGEAPHYREHDHLIHRDNTFGTAEEDAFRRDFTLNALFYDIATFSIIDYVGGLEDLRARLIRCIGDPVVRFREDPVRM